MTRPVIITCAVTGGIHTPTMSPYLPVTPEEIAESAIGASRAGATILHLHARNPQTGEPDSRPQTFLEFLPGIKQNCDAIVNITTGGGLGMSRQQRIHAAMMVSPEMASLNMGSMKGSGNGCDMSVYALDAYSAVRHVMVAHG